MDAIKMLSEHLKTRVSVLRKMKNDGAKIIGYTPGGFMPEEIVYACGAIPLCLIRGGDPESVTESLAYIPRFLDTFCRSQIGYWALEEELLYRLPDILIVPVTDCNSKVIADCWNYYTDVEVFRIGVPHNKGDDACEYYLEELYALRKKLESITGNRITDEKLWEEISYGNRLRSLFKSISFLRKDSDPAISSRDFVKLHHASYYADKTVFLEVLESLHNELKNKAVDDIAKRPRIFLTGSTLALGDNTIFEVLEALEGEVVFEEIAEGIRPYLNNVEIKDTDPMKALADAYFLKRIPSPWDRPWGDRLDRLIQIAKDFRVDGVLWYQLMYRDGYDMQAYWYEKKLKEKANLPMVKIESDYVVSEKGPIKTRIETFVEIMKEGMKCN